MRKLRILENLKTFITKIDLCIKKKGCITFVVQSEVEIVKIILKLIEVRKRHFSEAVQQWLYFNDVEEGSFSRKSSKKSRIGTDNIR